MTGAVCSFTLERLGLERFGRVHAWRWRISRAATPLRTSGAPRQPDEERHPHNRGSEHSSIMLVAVRPLRLQRGSADKDEEQHGAGRQRQSVARSTSRATRPWSHAPGYHYDDCEETCDLSGGDREQLRSQDEVESRPEERKDPQWPEAWRACRTPLAAHHSCASGGVRAI